jgi:hypothetical protein
MSYLEKSHTALAQMVELLQQNPDGQALALANLQLAQAPTMQSSTRPDGVPSLDLNIAAVQPDTEVASNLWVSLGGKALTQEVQGMKTDLETMKAEINPGRWDDLRSRHAELSKMVAVLQDMHCHHIRLLWEDLRAVCQELSSVGAASGVAAAQAAAAQAAVVDTAAAQAVTLWEELGTPRRAEIIGLVGEVRNLRQEVETLRTAGPLPQIPSSPARRNADQSVSDGFAEQPSSTVSSPPRVPTVAVVPARFDTPVGTGVDVQNEAQSRSSLSSVASPLSPQSSAALQPRAISPDPGSPLASLLETSIEASAAVSPATSASQADDLFRIKAEIAKYIGAAAHFKKYGNSPMAELYDDGISDGASYWRIMPCSEQGLTDVCRQARDGFDTAIEEGVSPESLALGLGRALTRFKLVERFACQVDDMMTGVLAQLRSGRLIRAPVTGPDAEYFAAVRDETMRGAVTELQKWNLVDGDFVWSSAAARRQPRPAPDSSEVAGEEDLPLSGRNRTGLNSPGNIIGGAGGSGTSPAVSSFARSGEAEGSGGAKGRLARAGFLGSGFQCGVAEAFSTGDSVSVAGRQGIVSMDLRPDHNFVKVRWSDDGTESDIIETDRVKPLSKAPASLDASGSGSTLSMRMWKSSLSKSSPRDE